jgi:hypothetical protein
VDYGTAGRRPTKLDRPDQPQFQFAGEIMSIAHAVGAMFSVGLIILGVGSAHAQEYPGQPIRILGSSPGDSADTVMRLIEPRLRRALGQPVIKDSGSRVN